jgi:hypothetical protein
MPSGDEPLTPDERTVRDRVIAELVEADKVFVCGICENYVDARFVEAHWRSHVTPSGRGNADA